MISHPSGYFDASQVFVCDGCGAVHFFVLGSDVRSVVEQLARWGWRMGGWDEDLCPACVRDGDPR